MLEIMDSEWVVVTRFIGVSIIVLSLSDSGCRSPRGERVCMVLCNTCPMNDHCTGLLMCEGSAAWFGDKRAWPDFVVACFETGCHPDCLS